MALTYFLLLNGIPGSSTLAQFKGAMELSSFSLGASVTTVTSGAGGTSVSRTALAPVSFTKAVDISSPHLMISALSGLHIAQGTVTAVEAGNTPQQLFQIKLTDVLITSYHLNAAADGAQDTFTLSSSKIEWTGLPPAPLLLNSPTTVGFDILKNIKL